MTTLPLTQAFGELEISFFNADGVPSDLVKRIQSAVQRQVTLTKVMKGQQLNLREYARKICMMAESKQVD
jgi:hypothetical protein